MQINSINPYYRSYRTKSVSMKGYNFDKKQVIAKAVNFLEENKLDFSGSMHVGSQGVKYSYMGVIDRNGYPLYLKMGDDKTVKDDAFMLSQENELIKIEIDNCSSVDDLLYKFAQKISGKTIYNPNLARTELSCALASGFQYSPHEKTKISVPDFFH